MDAPRSGGKPRGRGSRGGGGRGGRGKAARARGGSTRGMRVPPEYLHLVIAQRQGLDPSALPDGEEQGQGRGHDEDEEEEAAEQERYRPRQLGTNADRYREPEGEVLEGDEEDERASTYVFRE
jgi:hypothetical protein